MAGKTQTRAGDERLLTMLDLRDHDGLSAAKIGQRIGKGRNAVLGTFHRAKPTDPPEALECRCVKPENRDGGMPRRWWAQ